MSDIDRLRLEYADRQRRLAGSDRYSLFNPAHLFALQSRQRHALAALKRKGIRDLSSLRILEMGCGAGGVLLEYLGSGASPRNLFGIDLLYDRLLHAQQVLPGCSLTNAEGSHLPFPHQSFDLILHYGAISSILDPDLRQAICVEMLRLVRPSGLLLSYDFWLNPSNPQTRGLTRDELRRYFAGCRVEFQRITLAPPITRLLIRLSWGLCHWLESIKILNTHLLAIVHPPNGS